MIVSTPIAATASVTLRSVPTEWRSAVPRRSARPESESSALPRSDMTPAAMSMTEPRVTPTRIRAMPNPAAPRPGARPGDRRPFAGETRLGHLRPTATSSTTSSPIMPKEADRIGRLTE